MQRDVEENGFNLRGRKTGSQAAVLSVQCRE